MALTSRKHLGKQEELIDESGVQIRENDPINPVENQTWINTNQNILKTRKNNETIVLAEGTIGAALEVPPTGIMNLALSRSFFKNITADYEITDLVNYREGVVAYLKIRNTNLKQTEITTFNFPAPTSIANGSYFLINSANNVEQFYVWLDYDGFGVDPAIVGRTGVQVLTSAGLPEVTEITCPPASDISSGQHFLINSANDVVEYYVWFNKDLLGGDPLLSGKTSLQVVIESSDDADTVAAKVADILNALTAFSASEVGNVVTATTSVIGATTDSVNVNVNNLVINVTQQGKPSDTAEDLAEKVADALDALPEFDATSAGTLTTVETTSSGFVDDAQDGNIGGAFAINVTQQGSGTVFITFPPNVFVENSSALQIEGESENLYRFFRAGANTLVNLTRYDL